MNQAPTLFDLKDYTGTRVDKKVQIAWETKSLLIKEEGRKRVGVLVLTESTGNTGLTRKQQKGASYRSEHRGTKRETAGLWYSVTG